MEPIDKLIQSIRWIILAEVRQTWQHGISILPLVPNKRRELQVSSYMHTARASVTLALLCTWPLVDAN